MIEPDEEMHTCRTPTFKSNLTEKPSAQGCSETRSFSAGVVSPMTKTETFVAPPPQQPREIRTAMHMFIDCSPVVVVVVSHISSEKKKDGEPVVSKPGIHDPTKKQKKNIGYKTTRKRKLNEKRKTSYRTKREESVEETDQNKIKGERRALPTPAYNAGGFRAGFPPTRHPPPCTTPQGVQ